MPATQINSSANIAEAWKKYKHLWKREKYKSKCCLLKEGEISRKIFVIEKGCIRTWFYDKGREICFQFFFEGDVVSSAESFKKNLPGPFSIETIEPTTVRWLDQKAMSIIQQDLVLYPFLVERALEKQYEFARHFFSYLKNTPKERYQNLVRERPEVIKRVPLQYIASYLAITPVSLSRIRNQV